ncbi:RhoGAP-domain-containing protein [Basidiobolus meristosporus CBS 931.73]|uniref:RhoGAP-domain-containing protein n=1 Tax=Basidiobolus meristosporus CBS 931.73 TaxID=1314790 RepID=A0A1Y1Z3R2_9FUNG|nr:RhoGAP-domain-containing protein [Basidiobolus meristosporus CBS 931.73]|eukprot:ORY04910.1 RhoGAP-domain-containing protein [Basidiobolus meristosporus CBS 931.73]
MHPARRSTILTHWVRVAEACRLLGDMASWVAIALAVCSPIVVRLRETWKSVDRRTYHKVVHEWAPALFESGLYPSEIPIVPDTKAVMSELASSPSSAHVIPYFGGILVILDRINKAVPSLILGTSTINFRKYQDIYEIIKYTQSSWSHFVRNCRMKDTLSGTPLLQDYFEHLLLADDMAVDFDFAQEFSASLDCEPSINIRYLQENGGRLGVPNPAGHFPLDFIPVFSEHTTFLQMLACVEPFESNLASRDKECQPTLNGRPSLNISARHGVDTSSTFFKGISSASQLARKRAQSMPSKQLSKSLDSDKSSWWGLIQKSNGNASVLCTQNTPECLDRQECFLLTNGGELIFTIYQIQANNDRNTFKLVIKGGLVDRLIDILLFGINTRELPLVDSSGENFIFDESEEVIFDEQEYLSYFFMTFRSFLNPGDLLTKLHRKYVDSENDPMSPISDIQSHIESRPDIRASVMKVIEYWIRNHLHDFIDSLELKENIGVFFNEILEDEGNCTRHGLESSQPISEVEEQVKRILNYLTFSSLIPITILNQYKISESRLQKNAETLPAPSQATDPFEMILGFSPSLVDKDFDSPATENVDVSIPSIDDISPEQLLLALNECALELAGRVTPQDWVYTINDLEAQLVNPLAWYPKKNIQSTLDDETVISDIYMVLDSCRSAATNISNPAVNTHFLSSLPGNISSFYHLREAIKQWVIAEVTSFAIDSELRSSRIVKFLNVISLCHGEMSSHGIEKLEMFKSKFLVDTVKSQMKIPSFVERAIISGLIAPESRAFIKAWNDAAATLEKSTDSIQAFLNHQMSNNTTAPLPKDYHKSPVKHIGLIPCIGWVIEGILSVYYHIPDHLFSSKRMLNFEKRTLIYDLIQSFVQWPTACSKLDALASVSMRFLLSRHILPNNPELSVIRDYAVKENAKFKIPSGGHINGTSQNRKIFSKLIHSEQEKRKRDSREREKLDREVRDQQLDIQRRMNEEARLKEKRMKEQQQRKAKTKELEKMTNLFKSVHSSNPSQPDDISASLPTISFTPATAHSKNYHSSSSNDAAPNLLTQFPIAKPSLAINLINCNIAVENSRTKRDHVFKITSEEGCQYLLQAIDRQDMLSWVKAITDAAKEGAARRFTVLVEDARKERINQNADQTLDSEIGKAISETPEISKGRSSVFGIELSSLMKYEDGTYTLPVLVEKCLHEVEERGLYEVGIYRISGTASAIEQLRRDFNENSHTVDLSSEEWRDINVISGVLKQWLRELPEPVLTFDLYHDLISASVIDDYDTRLITIKNLVSALPKPNYILLKRLIEHLEMITDYEDINHMYASNLAIVFGPTLIRPPPGPLCFATSMANLGQQQALVKNLILQYHWIFDVEKEVEQQSRHKQYFLGTLEEEIEV